MANIYLKLEETIQPTQLVPWAYDIYDIYLDGFDFEIGRIVFRYGTEQQLRYCGHVGYTIEPEYRGHGYGAMALKKLMGIIVNMGYKKIILSCDKDNIASLKTIEKMNIVSKKLETNIEDKEYQSSVGLWIYEVEVIP